MGFQIKNRVTNKIKKGTNCENKDTARSLCYKLNIKDAEERKIKISDKFTIVLC